ncbi:hypothetical protein EOV40_005785 [Acetobacter oryzoeni]|uniref:Uncharacterized protein n=1 Tax=Acetobacter oryzoeni TaxID=2500548 RepID=A0A5B9GNT5_9PROT|nr:hypothetical protein EOV40_005785 [Acetobacter oryzoeni]
MLLPTYLGLRFAMPGINISQERAWLVQKKFADVFLEKVEQVNAGRSIYASAGAFLCVCFMLGLANLICHFGLHIDLAYLVRDLIFIMAFYFFLPPLILWVGKGRLPGGDS